MAVSHNPSGKRRPDAETYEFRNSVLALRKAGMSFPEIAGRLGPKHGRPEGFTQGYIFKVYKKALESIVVENVHAVRKLELERLDEIQNEVMQVLKGFTPLVNQGRVVKAILEDANGNPVLDDEGNPVLVNLQDVNVKLSAATAALKIMERRAKLLGLDAPTKVAATDPAGENAAPLVQFYLPSNERDVSDAEILPGA